MHSKNIPLFFIVASLTSTSLGLHLVVAARRSLDILARQTSQCGSICEAVESTVSSCTTTTCICNDDVATNIQDCVTCSVEANPSISVISAADDLIATYVSACSTVDGLPSITLNTNVGASQSTPNTATLPGGAGTSTANVPATTTSGSQVIIGPSSTASAPSLASSVGSTSTATGSTGGLPLKSSAASAFPSAIILHWTVALLGLAAGNILVF